MFLALPFFALAVIALWRTGFMRIDDLAYTDELTRLGNRRAFQHDAEALIRRAKAGSLALVLLDVDDLKTINNECGHLSGDELLRAVALKLQMLMPGSNALYRIGGDEFAILIERGRGESVTALLADLHGFPMRFRSCAHDHIVAFSCGFASSGEGETFDGLFRRADLRLRDVKRDLYMNTDASQRRRDPAPAFEQAEIESAAEFEDARPMANVASLEDRRRQRRESV